MKTIKNVLYRKVLLSIRIRVKVHKTGNLCNFYKVIKVTMAARAIRTAFSQIGGVPKHQGQGFLPFLQDRVSLDFLNNEYVYVLLKSLYYSG